MAIKSTDEKKMQKINFDQALEIFLDKFLELHPKNTWPDWIKKCTTYGGTKDENKFWRFAFTALPEYSLKENENWETAIDGTKALVKIDPDTGEKRYIISNTTANVITIFEAVINPNTSEITVTSDLDLSSIDGGNLQILKGT